MCITSVSVRISDMIRHRIMVLLYFGETPHGGHAFVPRFSRNSYYTTICDRIARGTAPRIRIRGKSFFSTKKDGTKPSFLVTIFSWKIKAICTDFVPYCLRKLTGFPPEPLLPEPFFQPEPVQEPLRLQGCQRGHLSDRQPDQPAPESRWG